MKKEEYEQYVIEPDLSILETMQVINSVSGTTVFICREGVLLASVSDGDIRRHLIRTGDLSSPILEVANKNPYKIVQGQMDEAQELMDRLGLTAVPMLTAEGVLIDIIVSDGKKKKPVEKLKLPVVIMAGGKGTRLAPYTQILPKPLIPIGDKTITEHIMERFERYGCTHFDLILNYKKNFIKSYFQDSEQSQDVDFIEETVFLGTAGGLRLLGDRYQGDFFVSNCDILVEADYAEIVKKHREEGNIITVVCAEKKVVIPYGTLTLGEDGHIASLQEKPSFDFLTNTGLYLISSRFLSFIPEDTFIHITDVIQSCIDAGEKVGCYSIPESAWMDMGQLDELQKMKERLSKE